MRPYEPGPIVAYFDLGRMVYWDPLCQIGHEFLSHLDVGFRPAMFLRVEPLRLHLVIRRVEGVDKILRGREILSKGWPSTRRELWLGPGRQLENQGLKGICYI